MARKSVLQPQTVQPVVSTASGPVPPKKIKVKGITPIEAHYMGQMDFAFSYISGVSEKNIVVLVLDSYLEEDSLLSFSSKYFQSLLKPGRSAYFGDYFEYNGNKIQFASILNKPKLENYVLFTVGDSIEYTSELEVWIKSGKYISISLPFRIFLSFFIILRFIF